MDHRNRELAEANADASTEMFDTQGDRYIDAIDEIDEFDVETPWLEFSLEIDGWARLVQASSGLGDI